VLKVEHLKKLLNLKIFLATVSNIAIILVLTGVIGQSNADMVTKVAELVGATLVQIGIMTVDVNKS
jgi:hypothetical protein